MRWLPRILLLWLLAGTASAATTYTLPGDTSSLPGTCSVSGSYITCAGNLIFGNKSTIVLTQYTHLTVSGDFTFGNTFIVNELGNSADMDIIISGNMNPTNGAIINANLTVAGSVNSGNNNNLTGEIVVSGNLNLGNNSTVEGNIVVSGTVNVSNNVNITGNIDATNINLGQGVTVTGDIEAENVNINGSNTVIDGNINATGSVNNNGTVTGYVNAPNINDNSGGIDDDLQCDIDTTDGPNTGPCFGGDDIDHYRLAFSGTAYTCGSADISVTACLDGSCASQATSVTQLVLASTAGNFSVSNLDFTGTAITSLLSNTATTVTISSTISVPSAPLRCFVDNVEGSCQVTFLEGGLEVDWGNTPGTPIPNQIAQETFGQNITVRVSDASCATNVDGAELSVAVDCVNPGSCNSNMLVLDGTTFTNTEQLNSTGIFFDNDGEAVISKNDLRYDDAGQIQLVFSESNNNTQGLSNTFISQPYLRASMTSFPALPVAGKLDYELTLESVGALDVVTPNYSPGTLGLLAIKINPDDGVGVHGAITLSNSGVSGTDSIATQNTTATTYTPINQSLVNFTSGSSSGAQLGYSELGEIELTFTDNNYFGLTLTPLNTLELGRFIPSYFGITTGATPLFSDTCDTFSYTGQNLALTNDLQLVFQPYNDQDVPVSNYIGDMMQLEEPSSLLSTDIVIADISGFSGSLTGSEGTLSQPDKDLPEWLLEGIEAQYIKSATPHEPFGAQIQVTFAADLLKDADDVCYKTSVADSSCADFSVSNIDGTEVRYGRILMASAFGPETETLHVPLQVQYYSGGDWVNNEDDSCTLYDWRENADDLVISALSVPDITGDIASLTALGQMLSGKSLSSEGIEVPAPGEGNVGTVLLQLDPIGSNAVWAGYLNIDWNEDGVISNTGVDRDIPEVQVSFGQYRGNDRIIHWREIFGN